MDLPNEVIISSIKSFCVCHFKDVKHNPDAKPHFYVNVPVNESSSLLLCIITSQIENRKNYYSKTNKKALNSLVYVDNMTLSFLSKESVIDCNQPELIGRHELIKMVDPKYGIEMKASQIPLNLQKKIIQAIQNSPVVKKYIKKC